MLKLENIVKDYSAGDSTVHALKGIDLSFRESEFVAILGHSGCGKTTLLNIIGGLDQYTSGDLVINGKSTRDFKDSDWDSYRNHSVGFVFQTYNLIPHQNVLSNVELALTLSGVSKSERRARAKKALEDVGLGDQLYKKPNQMSGGQMQRVAIARALVNDPDILLADEPTGALDSETSVQVMEILKEISRNRLIIMVTHNPELAENYATRIVRLKDGCVTSDSSPYLAGAETPAEEGSRRRPSMSFFTALSLSMNNLMTKKARTFLTAFAGSIGIIGIALILSLSNGIQSYIDQVQEDTLSSYPITIEAESMDMSAMVASMMGINSASEESQPHEPDRVYSSTVLYDLLNNLMSTEKQTNNLGAFKEYVESGEGGFDQYVSAIQYSYDLNMDIYAQDIDGNIFLSDVTDLLQTCMGAMYGGDYSSYFEQFGAAYSHMEVWEELLPAPKGSGEAVNELVREQYELVYGAWPASYDEAVLIVNKDNEISDLVIYCLGLGSQDTVINSMQGMMNGEKMDSFQESWSYGDICGLSFKVVLPSEYYQYDPIGGTYTDISATDTGMDFVFNSDAIGTRVKIVGILRPSEDALSSKASGSIGYTSALTDYLVEKACGMEIIKKQLDDPATDVISGLPFPKDTDKEPTDAEKAGAIIEHLVTLSDAEKAAAYIDVMGQPSDAYVETVVAQQMEGMTRESIEEMIVQQYAGEMGVDGETVSGYIADMDDETLFALVEKAIAQGVQEQYKAAVEQRLAAQTTRQLAVMLESASGAAVGDLPVQPLETWQLVYLYDHYMPPVRSSSSYEDNLKKLGQVDFSKPKTMNIYAASFENKDKIADAISEYNKTVGEDDQIEYTDYVALLMSSITTIISAISYVLIAFVAISLVVSSIMIGIITYISVLERTKEIGILRAIGASKKDISRVFNAETLIEGFVSGILGIGITLLIILPVNLILRHLTGIATIGAALPVAAAIILVAISMSLTFIAGLIPSGIAARKDPVEALRTE